MQDWLTIRSPGTTTTVRQSASDWLDLEGFRDLSMWIQVADVTSGAEVKLTLETAPMEDESLFQTLTMQPSGTVLSTRGVYFAASRANVFLPAWPKPRCCWSARLRLPTRAFLLGVAPASLAIAATYAVLGYYARERQWMTAALVLSVAVPLAATWLARRALPST